MRIIDLASRATIERLCQQYGLQPRRERGQNFLVDRVVLEEILNTAELSKEEIVLEIGPGFGVLTTELTKYVRRVVSVEIDKRLVSFLHTHFLGRQGVTIIHDDILHFLSCTKGVDNKVSDRKEYCKSIHGVEGAYRVNGVDEVDGAGDEAYEAHGANAANGADGAVGLLGEGYVVVANLPYQVTSRVLRLLLEAEHRPSRIVVMIQKEVAERIVASPGQMSMLSVMVQYYGKPEIVAVIPRTAFWPEPEVDSAIIRVSVTPPSPSYHKRGTEGALFFRLAKIGFSSKRKQLQHNLAAGLRIPREDVLKRLASVGLAPTVRAQELSVDDWKKLVQIF